ncbi:hypothetical protein [Paludibacterium sp. THUN1379]|uniref:hypothetical protein n=1 Tax=Paludibacterium sp. THUN1379 TaxID=3112107 RepID=UPI0030D59EB5
MAFSFIGSERQHRSQGGTEGRIQPGDQRFDLAILTLAKQQDGATECQKICIVQPVGQGLLNLAHFASHSMLYRGKPRLDNQLAQQTRLAGQGCLAHNLAMMPAIMSLKAFITELS